MNYSTVLDCLAHDHDGIVFDLGSVYERLCALVDSRHRRGIRYALAVILVAALVAKLAGEDTPEGIAEWVKLRRAFFIESFQVKGDTMPHAMTYRRVLAEASLAAALDTLTRDYLLSQPGTGDRTHIALDGKTLRGVRAADQTRALHLLAAYLPGAGVVLMQAEVAGHTNEIPVAPHVLKVLDLQGKIVTGDALLAQRELSQVIVAAGGDYLWTVKDNQPRLRQGIEQLLTPGDVPTRHQSGDHRCPADNHRREESRSYHHAGLNGLQSADRVL
jgi:predicted transposase YbfD/YdcC